MTTKNTFSAASEAAPFKGDGSKTFRRNKWETALDPLQLVYRTLALDVAGVERGLGFEQHHVGFFFGRRKVLDAARDDDELARIHKELALGAVFAHAHAQRAFHHQK